MKRILVVDDEPSMRELLGIMLRREGYEVVAAESRAMAAAALAGAPADMVITDIKLPDGDGIEILRHVKAASPETVVIVMTAYGTTQTAVAALKLGAHDYLTKPFDVEELKIVVRGALEKRQLEEENILLKAEFRSRHGLDRIVGVSPPMRAVFDVVRSVAPTASTILITGESGTGKELVAKAIHALSPRRDAPFVSINCGALPENLLESELFGHVKGAFTDAHQNKKGLFEAAHRGTLFLDEVGETSPAMQVKLLRSLQDRKIRRVGGTAEVEVDVRLVAATNRPLESLVRERRFREDLYYRLNVIPIRIPPLRERREDIPLLTEHFLGRFSEEMGKSVTRISSEAMGKLQAYSWPGNVRELENVVERAVALEITPTVLVERLPEALLTDARHPSADELREGFSLDDHLRTHEGGLVRRALGLAAGDRGRACRLLGVTPRSLRYLIHKHRLQGEG
ncbi:MAG: sigma-54-dependent Fis family transcriptional regulator [Acidobacteria bacterium]|nr:sigma-54-dependent Fis family transcriptional regulator [Acidobacteriota bacterium]